MARRNKKPDIGGKNAKGEGTGFLNELKAYTEEHFRDEEEYMEWIHYEGLAAQKRAHEAFIDKLENIDLDEIENNPQE